MLLRDILAGDDPEILAIAAVIDHVGPDVLILTDFDFDAQGIALAAFADQLSGSYPYLYAAQPNAGVQTGLDVDADGYAGDARDALGYGRFLGDGGMAILSRHPIRTADIMDYSDVLWRDIPGATLPRWNDAAYPSDDVHATLPVSSTAHWVVPINLGDAIVSVLAFDATAPVFDGPEDFNGLRNRDELRLWEHLLDGAFGPIPINPILVGNVNLDPADGQGLRDGIRAVLSRSDLQDPAPTSAGGRLAADPTHRGDPAFDTVDWPSNGPGNLRVSYILPTVGAQVVGAGVFWPAPTAPFADLLGGDGLAAGAHRLVWVDITIESLRQRHIK